MGGLPGEVQHLREEGRRVGDSPLSLPARRVCSMGYHQVTSRERYLIAEHKSMGKSVREIGRAVCRSASTISRELRRNACTSDGRYRVEKALSYARARRSRCRRGTHFDQAEVAQVHRLVQQRWSPEQVSGRQRKQRQLRIGHDDDLSMAGHGQGTGRQQLAADRGSCRAGTAKAPSSGRRAHLRCRANSCQIQTGSCRVFTFITWQNLPKTHHNLAEFHGSSKLLINNELFWVDRAESHMPLNTRCSKSAQCPDCCTPVDPRPCRRRC